MANRHIDLWEQIDYLERELSTGVREVETTGPLSRGAPFFMREDVLGLRRETADVAVDALREAPPELRASPATEVVAEFLRMVLEFKR